MTARLDKMVIKSFGQVLLYHVLYAFHRERGIVIPEIATPLCGHSTGSYRQWRKVEDNRKYMYFTTFVITREDVNEYMSHHPEYTKANRFKDIICKIYI